ncbi:hypothetical protein [Actibacterium sp. D379-3]
MKRRDFLACTIAALALSSPARAQSLEEALLSQLHAQGFTRIQRSRTLLGRVRLAATGNGIEREIIFNPRTGEILRDFWEAADGDAPRLFSPDKEGDGGDGAGNSAAGDRDDDDSGDDQEGDDHGGGGDDQNDDADEDEEDDDEDDDREDGSGRDR